MFCDSLTSSNDYPIVVRFSSHKILLYYILGCFVVFVMYMYCVCVLTLKLSLIHGPATHLRTRALVSYLASG